MLLTERNTKLYILHEIPLTYMKFIIILYEIYINLCKSNLNFIQILYIIWNSYELHVYV